MDSTTLGIELAAQATARMKDNGFTTAGTREVMSRMFLAALCEVHAPPRVVVEVVGRCVMTTLLARDAEDPYALIVDGSTEVEARFDEFAEYLQEYDELGLSSLYLACGCVYEFRSPPLSDELVEECLAFLATALLCSGTDEAGVRSEFDGAIHAAMRDVAP